MNNFKELFNDKLYVEIERLVQEKADKINELNKVCEIAHPIECCFQLGELSKRIAELQAIINHLCMMVRCT